MRQPSDDQAQDDPGPWAPEEVQFCARCAARMGTRDIAGKPRRACTLCGYIHFVEPKVGVGVMIIEAERLLLVRRGQPPAVGKWALPAGYLDIGEDPRDTAVREAREETGLEVRVTGLVDVYANPIGQGASLFVLFEALRVGGRLAADDDAEDAAFFDIDALPELAFPSTRAAVERLERRLRTRSDPDPEPAPNPDPDPDPDHERNAAGRGRRSPTR